MDATSTIIIALRNLRLHKVRSALTMLGIIFGVGAVVAMLSIGEGARWEILQQIELLGIQNISVRSVKPAQKVRRAEQAAEGQTWVLRYGLLRKDADHIAAVCRDVDVLVPLRNVRKDVWYRDRRMDARVVGTTPSYPAVLNFRPERGRFICEYDMRQRARVCAIGWEVKAELFGIRDPMGQHLKIGDQWYRVVGVMQSRGTVREGAEAISSYDLNRDIYIPLSSAFDRFGTVSITHRAGQSEVVNVEFDEIIVRTKRVETVRANAGLIRTMLERSHKEEDYEIVVPRELLSRREQAQRIFNVVMVSIATISLLVGGIGIMNIMLASVLERTREIGIRRAVGAKRRDIVRQFLTETVVLSGTGGVIGIILGVAGAKVVSAFAGLTTIIAVQFPLAAFTISVATGIIFGMYPARKAALMDPIQALRYE